MTDASEGTNVISAPLPTRVLVNLYAWYFTGGSLDSANFTRPRKRVFWKNKPHGATMNAIWQITPRFSSLSLFSVMIVYKYFILILCNQNEFCAQFSINKRSTRNKLKPQRYIYSIFLIKKKIGSLVSDENR